MAQWRHGQRVPDPLCIFVRDRFLLLPFLPAPRSLLLLRRAIELTATARCVGSPCAGSSQNSGVCLCRVFILVAIATGRQHRRRCRRTCLQDKAPSFFMNATLFSIGVVVGRPRSALEPPLTLISIMTGPSTAAEDRYVKAALVSASDSTVSASA